MRALAIPFVLLMAGCPQGETARPEDGAIPDAGLVDESAPGVTARGLTLDGPPSAAVAAALKASREPAPPLPKCTSRASKGKASSRPELIVQDGHTGMLMDVELSDDGTMLASAGIDGIVRVWDTRRGLLLRRIPSGAGTFFIDLSGNAAVLAVYAPSGDDLSIETHWLDRGGKPTVNGKGAVGHQFGLSGDGTILAAITNEISLFDSTTGKKTGAIPLPQIGQAIAMAPTKKLAAADVMGKLSIADLRKKTLLNTRARVDFVESADSALKLDMSDTHVAVQTYKQVVQIYPVSGKGVRTLDAKASDIAVGGDSVWVLGAQRTTLERFNLATGKKEGSIPPELLGGGNVTKIAASRDGSTLALAGDSDRNDAHEIKIVDANSGTVLNTLAGHAAQVTTIAVSPRADLVMTGSRAGLAWWSLDRAELLGLETGETTQVAFDPKGETFVAVDFRDVQQRDAVTGALLRRFSPTDGTHATAIVPGTQDLLTAGAQSVRRWSMPRVKKPATAPAYGDVNAPEGKDVGPIPFLASGMALPASGKVVALVGSNQHKPGEMMVAVMDLSTGKRLWTDAFSGFPQDLFVGIDPKGDRVLVSTKEVTTTPKGERLKPYLRVYAAKTGKLESRTLMDTRGPIAFFDKTVAIGGRAPALLDARTLKARARVDVPDTEVTAIGVDRKHGRLLFGGDSGVMSVVDPASGRVNAMLLATPDGEYVATTPDGAYKASLDGARNVGWTFTRPLEGFSFDQFGTVLHRPDAVIAAVSGKHKQAIEVPRPPRLSLGKAPRRVDGDVVKLKVEAQGERWVERLRVFVNGRPAVDELVCAKQKTVTLEAPLSPGRNRVTVIGYDDAGFATNPAQLDVTSTGKGARPDLWVITAGVSAYPNLPKHLQLAYADDDAQSIADGLEGLAGEGKPFAELKRITLLNKGVTPQNVERSLAALADMKADDLAIVFFAGHGVRLSDGKMLFLTSEASLTEEGARKASVGWDRIESVLRAAKGRTVLMLDACHSGHLSTDLIAPNEQLAAELARDNRAGVFVFAASRGAQFSYEVAAGKGSARGLELAWDGAPQVTKKPAEGHGLFTAAVLEAFAGDAIDRDRSGAIELSEFVDYVTERVRAASNGRQTPWVVRREMFGDYAVAPAK